MSTLDRMFFISYLRSYAIVLVSLLSLYVIVDLFTNLNDFTGSKGGFASIAQHILGYYSVQIAIIFDRLSELITLIAAVFAIAWMQRNNELLPQLSAGVPTRRVIRPIVFGAFLTLLLGPLNSELVIPEFADALSIPRDDPDLKKPTQVRGAFDPITREHVVGQSAFRRERKVTLFEYTSPANTASGLIHLTAKEAEYIPFQQNNPLSGGWWLYNAKPVEITTPLPENIIRIMPGQYFFRTEALDFNAITRRPSWYNHAPTNRLWEMLDEAEAIRQPAVAVVFHMRLTRIMIGLVMLVLGLAVILRDQNQHVFISSGLCLAISATFYAWVLACRYMGESEFLPPPLAAWLPVMIFGPLAVAMFDAIHT